MPETPRPVVDVVADALHHQGCNHHTGGPAECDSRALDVVAALAAEGYPVTAEGLADVFDAGVQAAADAIFGPPSKPRREVGRTWVLPTNPYREEADRG